jgi:hypothetical protein
MMAGALGQVMMYVLNDWHFDGVWLGHRHRYVFLDVYRHRFLYRVRHRFLYFHRYRLLHRNLHSLVDGNFYSLCHLPDREGTVLRRVGLYEAETIKC